MRNLQEKPFYGMIKEFEHWVVLFREKQVTIGSLVIMSKNMDATSLGSLSSEAWREFGVVTSFSEKLLTNTFGAEKFNYLALMMYDPEVHFHLIPRYSKPVEFNGHSFVDADWPDATKRVAIELEPALKQAIQDALLTSANGGRD